MKINLSLFQTSTFKVIGLFGSLFLFSNFFSSTTPFTYTKTIESDPPIFFNGSDTILYVKEAAIGNNNGSSWLDAYANLQDALSHVDTCPSITQIWVAAGTYKPTTTTDRTISFSMKNNLAIYGGFLGNETLLADRPTPLALSTLSGDIGVLNDSTDNSYHVVANPNNGINLTAILDGFTIEHGYADGSSPSPISKGGGMYNLQASPTIRYCTFRHNWSADGGGGGMWNELNASPQLFHCTFYNNATDWVGGGMVNANGSNALLSSCIFSNNTGSMSGGAIHNSSSNPILINSVFYNNSTQGNGGAIFNGFEIEVNVTNCSFSGNVANGKGGAFFNSSTDLILINSILWGNSATVGKDMYNQFTISHPTISYTLLEESSCPPGAICNDGMIYNTDPLFLSSTDFHLQPCSPAKDAGIIAGAPTIDADGDPRPQGLGIDLGYDETNTTCNTCIPYTTLYVDENATGNHTGSTWIHALTDLTLALAQADTCLNVVQIFVAQGTYFPTQMADRTISFTLRNNLAIFGGFTGTEAAPADRPSPLAPTFLSGDIGMANDSTDNSYHVIFNSNINNTAIIDGFIISDGNAEGGASDGAGMYNQNASPQITNCTFLNNTASNMGGGLLNDASNPILTNCYFSKNTATDGGGIGNKNAATPQIINCAFTENTSLNNGGAISNNSNTTVQLTNCSFSINSAANNGGGIFNNNTTSSTLINCILWGNTATSEKSIYNAGTGTATISFTLIEETTCPSGATCNAGMIFNENPLFISDTDLHLQVCSPAEDVGTATSAPSFDVDGNNRPMGAGFDIGFDEASPNLVISSDPIPPNIYKTSNSITSTGRVATGTLVIFDALNVVLLNPNFEVEIGGELEVITGVGCLPAFNKTEKQ